MTIAQAIETIKNSLQQCNEVELRMISKQLLQHFWQISDNDFYVNRDKMLDENWNNKFTQALLELQNNRPIQYVIGKTIFCDLAFFVDENVLIPRPETEELVNWIVENEKNKNAQTLVDIGTGSGCIAIALAKKIENAKVFAIDISQKAIEKAKYNAEYNNVNVDFLEINILQKINLQQKFDIIISNPPYICENEKTEMQNNVLNFEPHTALFVPNNDALKFYNAIADFASLHLAENGKIYLEINERFGSETTNLFIAKGFANVELRKDLSGKNRMLKISK